MPVPNMQSLAALLKMQSPSNMNSTGDPYVDRRRSEIVGGADEYAPSELEQMITQRQLGDQGMGVSRDMIRSAGIDRGQDAEKAAMQKLRMLVLPEQIKGQYGMATAEANARAAADRMQTNQDAIAARGEQSQRAIDARAAATQTGQNTRQQVGIDAATAHQQAAIAARPVPAALQKGVDTARGNYGGVMSSIGRAMGFNGGKDAYSTALEQAITANGTDMTELHQNAAQLAAAPGKSLDEKAAALGASTDQLSPYERAWLQLKLGIE